MRTRFAAKDERIESARRGHKSTTIGIQRGQGTARHKRALPESLSGPDVQFHLSCACGKSIEVSGSAAGSSVVCPCGRAVAVPSLSELRRQSGLPAFKASAALIIEEMKAARELPAPVCVECGQHTEDKAVAVADCERAWGRAENGGWMWGIAAIAVFFVGVWAVVAYYLSRNRKEFGDTVIVQMPIRICHGCRGCLKRNLLIPILLVLRYAGLAAGIVLLFFFPAVAFIVLAAAIVLFVVERALRRQYQKALKWRRWPRLVYWPCQAAPI